MKINWKIDYLKKTATCSQMTVSIVKIDNDEPLAQKIEDTVISLGFKKLDGDSYFCLVTDISSELWKSNLEDNKLLPNYMSQLGDIFNENYFNNPLVSKNQVEKFCEVCGEPFLGTGKSKFCSNKCKQKNKNDKNKK